MRPGWLRIAVYVVGGLVALLLSAAAAAMFLVPTADLARQAERAIEAASGRDVTLSGRTSFTLYPVLGLKARDVTVANVDGGVSPYLAKAAEVDVGVALLPLLRGQVEVRQLVLMNPDIALEIDAQGRGNWVFTPPPASGAPGQAAPVADPAPQVVKVSDVRVTDGRIRLRDLRGVGADHELEQVALRARMDSLDQPATLEGTVVYRAQPVAMQVVLGNPRAVHSGIATPLSFTLTSQPLEVSFDGQMDMRAGAISGDIRAAGPSLRGMADWVGTPIGGGPGLAAFDVSGNLAFDGVASRFTNARFQVDAISGRGDFAIETGRLRPFLSGRVEVEALDLNPYLQPAEGAQVATAAAAGDPTAIAEVAQANGVNAEAAWAESPIALPGLKALDANLDLTIGGLVVQRIKIDRAVASFVLLEGRMGATLSDLALYGGRGRGRLELDASTPFLRFAQELDVDGVAAQGLLADAVGWRNLSGQALVQLRLSGGGQTQRALMRSLAGFVRLRVQDGAVVGVDLGGVARNLRNALRGDLVGPDARTVFAQFEASFLLADGIAATQDLRLTNSTAQVTGTGVLDIGQQLLDMRMAARGAPGRDGRTSGVALPFRALGPWSGVRYSADLLGGGRAPVERQVRDVQTRARALGVQASPPPAAPSRTPAATAVR